ncbi:hypothetical protein [Acidithiobacillus thiooxidans]|uniref:hypothetical protein n=1 Tax=Acidithiobacillus thiooxidans TaxID=930 RepID=UPI0004E0DF89|nr:hypothetical protein [Acidithiobacillus thiooxidans]
MGAKYLGWVAKGMGFAGVKSYFLFCQVEAKQPVQDRSGFICTAGEAFTPFEERLEVGLQEPIVLKDELGLHTTWYRRFQQPFDHTLQGIDQGIRELISLPALA